MIKNKCLVIVGLLFLFSSSVHSAGVTKEIFTGELGRPILNYSQISYAALFIVALVIIALVLVKKFRINNLTHSEIIDVIHSYAITAKDKLLVIKVGHEYLLLSYSSAGIQKLHVLNKEHFDQKDFKLKDNKHEFSNIFMSMVGKNRHA